MQKSHVRVNGALITSSGKSQTSGPNLSETECAEAKIVP